MRSGAQPSLSPSVQSFLCIWAATMLYQTEQLGWPWPEHETQVAQPRPAGTVVTTLFHSSMRLYDAPSFCSKVVRTRPVG